MGVKRASSGNNEGYQVPCGTAARGYILRMTVEEIKAAIPKLTVEERAELARCLNGWEDDEWDRQMKKDLAAGRLDKVLKKVESDMTQGKLSSLP
jgi:hypothetical protein